jgi:hypothetical protein
MLFPQSMLDGQKENHPITGRMRAFAGRFLVRRFPISILWGAPQKGRVIANIEVTIGGRIAISQEGPGG